LEINEKERNNIQKFIHHWNITKCYLSGETGKHEKRKKMKENEREKRSSEEKY